MYPPNTTLKHIIDAHSCKRDYEKYLPVSRFFFRPAGFVATWIAIRIGLSSEAVSWLSAVTGLFACAALATGKTELISFGIVLLLLFNLLDCVDGSIARVMKTENPYGRFLDSVCGEMVDVIFWTIIGIMAYQHRNLVVWQDTRIYGASLWLIIGVSASFLMIQINYLESTFDELIRSQWEKVIRSSNPETIHDDPDSRMKPSADDNFTSPFRIIFNNNMRVRENHYLLLILALFMRSLDVFLACFFIYYLVLYVTLLITYSRRGRIVKEYLSMNSKDKESLP